MEMGIKEDVVFCLGVTRPFLVTFKPQGAYLQHGGLIRHSFRGSFEKEFLSLWFSSLSGLCMRVILFVLLTL